jgi:hypothetical protein
MYANFADEMKELFFVWVILITALFVSFFKEESAFLNLIVFLSICHLCISLKKSNRKNYEKDESI